MIDDFGWMYETIRTQYRGRASGSYSRLLKASRGDIRIRTRRRGCVGLLLMLFVSVFVMLIGIAFDMREAASRLAYFGLISSMLVYLALHILDDKVERAWIAYVLIPLPILPISIVLIGAGFVVSRHINDLTPVFVFIAVLFLSSTHAPIQFRRRASELHDEFNSGFLRSAFEKQSGTWNSVYDLDEHINYQIPWFWIVLDIIGPAVGMQISRTLAPEDDLYLIAYMTFFFAYILFRPLLLEAIARAKFILDLEAEFNSRILLKPIEVGEASS